jgi:tetratricopeptide (TPR) repeat protein
MCSSPIFDGQSGGVSIPGTVGVVHGDIVVHKITYGPTAEGIVDDLEKRGLLVAAELAGLQRAVIIKLAQRLKPEALDFNQAVTELEHAVAVALEVIARGEQGTNLDAFIDAVLKHVGEKTGTGDFDGGARTVDEALAELDRREAEQRDLARRSRVALLEAGVRVDILRRDAAAVAGRIETLVAAEHPTERSAWLPEFRQRYDAFFQEGEAKGINFSLSVAIELARRMAAAAHDRTERGIAWNLLGNALQRLGEREVGTARLEEAVAAYRDALKERTRERVPLQWAMTQNNLGSALSTLGEREAGTARLEEAVDAFRDALKERTRERVPLQAMTQNNLGNALRTLGEREVGTARLEEAVAAYRDALKERTRERVPLDWAMTQNNLGTALQTLGEREVGTARLEEAVAAYRDALKERTRERVPLQAMTQNNLGNALRTLGEREVGTARLEEAVAAYRDALKERTRERVPLDWAMTQNNLGNALQTLGEREVGTARLEEAVAAYRDALKERTRERVPLQAMTQNNLGNALQTLGEREVGTARLEEAVAAWDACLTVAPSVWPEEWVRDIRSRRDETESEIARRASR